MSRQYFCRCCHKPLTNPQSVDLGIGPECRAKENTGEGQADAFLDCPPSDPIERDVVITVDGDGNVSANIPHTVVEHSPTGYGIGYAGSGPADLALNILNAFIPPCSDGKPPVKMYAGFASETAARYHQEVKDVFIATMGKNGGTVSREEVLDLINTLQDK